jgi:cyclophilin family peptidyl-prolyl cis-trans isomerase
MRSGSKSPRSLLSRLALETLEGREVPATLAPLDDFTTPTTKALYVPLTVTGVNGNVTYTATSTNSLVQVQVVSGGTTLKLTVSGTDSGGNPFQGDLIFRLFDDLAPVTTARIVSLVQGGFYDGLTFHRILDGFVAQGGDPDGDGTGGSGVTIDDEFNPLLTFNSPGLLAMANSGDDTGDSQFFITDIDLTLAQQPQHLNFNHTIFGQLVAGFDTFTKLMTTPVGSPIVGDPVNPVTIVSATIVPDDPNGVLRVTAPAGFTGTTTVTVTPSDAGTSSTGDSFDVTFVADPVNEPPFLGPVADVTTAVGTGVTIPLTSTELEGNAVTYSVISALTGGQSINLNPRIDQATGRVTLTPPPGFTGAIDVKVGVRDASGTFDTQVFTLTVTGSFDLIPGSDTGALNDDNITGSASPTFTVLAPAGQTVTVTVNGATVGTATPLAGSPGQYRITIPTSLLRVGDNTIAGTATQQGGSSTALTPLTFAYVPSLRNAYVVPGTDGSTQSVTFRFTSTESKFDNEVGYFVADDLSGAIGSLRPGDAGYFAAAMARRQVVFPRGTAAGASTNVSVRGGDVLVMYIVQNGTSAGLLATNPSNTTAGGPIAFFSLGGANVDGVAHVSSADDPAGSQAIYGWEDLTGGGDRDYNDAVVLVAPAGASPLATLRVPGAAGRGVATTAQLQTATKAQTGSNLSPPITTARGEVGVIVADDATGKIGNLNPGDPGYPAAALARAQVLFASGAAAGTSINLDLAGGQFLMFYYVPGGTAAGVLANNPNNTPGSGRIAFFSLTAANPDGDPHVRNFHPERVTRSVPGADEPYWIHMMGTLNGGAEDFDDIVFTVRFGI